MPTFVIDGRGYEADEDGFLQEPERWNEHVATEFADTELSAMHCQVIHYIRSRYMECGVSPMLRRLCRETGYPWADIYRLFPSGPARGACKVAGLPKPTGFMFFQLTESPFKRRS